MNLTRAQKVRLGVFVFVGVGLLGGGVLALAGMKYFEKRDTYSVHFKDDVGGLEPSAPVKYQGLRIGRVEDMYVAPDDTKTIEVILSIDPRTKLHEGTVATLAMSGITGLKSVNLTAGDPRKPLIAPGSRLEAGQSLVDRLSGRADEIALKVEIVTNQLARWTNDKNRERFEKLLDSFTALSNEVSIFLATNRVPMQSALGGVTKASDAIARLSGTGDDSIVAMRNEVVRTLEEAQVTLREIQRPLSKLDPDAVAGTVTSTKAAMDGINKRVSSKELDLALNNLVQTMSDVTHLLEDVDLSVRASREDFVTTLSQLRQAAEDLREFSRIIAQDPSALLRSRE